MYISTTSRICETNVNNNSKSNVFLELRSNLILQNWKLESSNSHNYESVPVISDVVDSFDDDDTVEIIAYSSLVDFTSDEDAVNSADLFVSEDKLVKYAYSSVGNHSLLELAASLLSINEVIVLAYV